MTSVPSRVSVSIEGNTVTIGNTAYSIRNIASVTVVKIEQPGPDKAIPFLLCVLGLAITCTISPIGVAIVVGGLWGLSRRAPGPKWTVSLVTNAGQVQALTTEDERNANEVAASSSDLASPGRSPEHKPIRFITLPQHRKPWG